MGNDKKRIIVVMMCLLLIVVAILTSCGKDSSIISITGNDGKVISIDTEGFSKDQETLLKEVANGKESINTLLQSDLFTEEEKQSMGLIPTREKERTSSIAGDNFSKIDLSGIDINSLDLEELSDEQIQAIKDVISGDRTFGSLIEENILSMEELQRIGLNMGRQRP